MKKLIYAFLLSSSLLFVSCNKELDDPGPTDNNSSKTILDLAYGTNPAQVMDIYLPAGRSASSTKVILLIHGGSWTSGDKNDPLFFPFVDSIKRRLPGYAVFNINYRLSANPLNLFPTQELDIKTATSFILGKRSEYGISDKFVLIGASAGGHLAMLQAYKNNAEIMPKAVVSFFGPSDLLDMYNNPLNPLIPGVMALTIGKTPVQDPAIYTNSSPVNFISSSSAMPTILLHGGLDPLVRPEQSIAVRDKLTLAGIGTQYVFYPNAGHGDWDGPTYTDAFNRIAAFLNQYVP